MDSMDSPIVVKATSKGQITLPAKWRKSFNTNQYIIKDTGRTLEIRPFNLESIVRQDEYTVFDAIRDNKGKGIKAKDLLRLLKKTLS